MAAEEPDGLEEVIGGGVRVAATVGGQVLERTAMRRAAEARDRAAAARAAAEADRARAAALSGVDRVPDRRERADTATAVAVLRTDDRLTARRTLTDRLDEARGGPAGEAEAPAAPSAERSFADRVEAHHAGALEPDVEQAATVAERNQARPAAEAVRGEAGAARAARAPRARGRGKATERDRGR